MEQNTCMQCRKTCDSMHNRIVRDTCGHFKCRLCLLDESDQCSACLNQMQTTHEVFDEIGSCHIEENSGANVNANYCNTPADISSRTYTILSTSNHKFPTNDTDGMLDLTIHTNFKENGLYELYPNSSENVTGEKHTDEVNNDDSNYICDICQKRFHFKCRLVKHINRHNGIKPVECRTCNAKFYYAYDLKKHNLIHSNKKPYVCQTCNASFRSSSNLSLHQHIHSNTRFSCSECGKYFRRKVYLKMHLKIHTKSKSYNCSMCEDQFHTKKDMLRHELTHTGNKKYNCSICNASLGRKDNLRRHFRNTHKAEYLKLLNKSKDNNLSIDIDKTIQRQSNNVNENPKDKNKLCNEDCLLHKKESHENVNDDNVSINKVHDTENETIVTEIDKKDNKTWSKIVEANNKRESVIFKSAINEMTSKSSNNENESIVKNCNTDERNNEENGHPSNDDNSIKTTSVVEMSNKNLPLEITNSEADSSDNDNSKKTSVVEMCNNSLPLEITNSEADSSSNCKTITRYCNRLENKAYHKNDYETRKELPYIHKKMNYDIKKNLSEKLSTDCSQHNRVYEEFDDAKATWCLYRSYKVVQNDPNKTTNNGVCTPESIELYRKILIPKYRKDDAKSDDALNEDVKDMPDDESESENTFYENNLEMDVDKTLICAVNSSDNSSVESEKDVSKCIMNWQERSLQKPFPDTR